MKPEKPPLVAKDTLLQRAPELMLKLHSDNRLKITVAGENYTVDHFGLEILAVFSSPCTFAEGLDGLGRQARGAQDWVDMSQTILSMVKAGILRRVGIEEPAGLRASPNGFDAAYIHILMLNDRRRTATYIAALRSVVQPGDRVADIGTGSGVLAVSAAQAGAGRVYAIEASGIGRLAERVFAANEYAQRISLVSGWSTQVELPEKVDVLVSEIIGNDPFGERVLEATIDARKRFLKPGGRMVPVALQVFGLPLTIPANVSQDYLFDRSQVEKWQAWYGVDFSPLVIERLDAPFFFAINPYETRTWPRLAGATALVNVDLATAESLLVAGEAEYTAEADGLLNGVLIYFELELAAGVRLSISPEQADQENSWRTLVWRLIEPLELMRGERFKIRYGYRGTGMPDGVWVDRVGDNE